MEIEISTIEKSLIKGILTDYIKENKGYENERIARKLLFKLEK